MYQIDNSTAATTQPAATSAGTAGFFTDGNPATSTPATIVPAEWLNAVMMELSNVVTAAGLTLSKPTYNQVLAAIKRLGQSTIILADTGAANAYTAVNSPPLVAGTWVDGVVQQVKIAHANTGASTYAPDGLTAIPIYGLGLQPLQGGELALNGTAVLMRATIAGVNNGNPIAVLMECAGGAQQIAPATQSQHAVQYSQVRKVLTANLNLYVATTGNDSTNTGLTAGSPFLTLQKAYNFLQQNYDLAGQYVATINVAAGTYTAGLLANGPVTGATGYQNVVVNGTGAGTNVSVGSSSTCFGAATGAQYIVSNCSIQSSGSGSNGVVTNDALSRIGIGAGVTFGGMSGGAHIFCSGGLISVSNAYTIAGGAANHLLVSNPGSLITYGAITVTLSGTPAFSNFAIAQYLSQINVAGITFSGSATGTRYSASNNAIIYTNGGGASYLPGNSAGSTASGGLYV